MAIINKLFRIGGGKRSRTDQWETHQDGPYRSEKLRARQRRQSTKGVWTCEQGPYRYPINESPKDPWERCYDIVDKSDEEMCKGLKDEISYLLVVASLFLAIVTTFSIESFKWLKEDKEDTMVGLLGQAVRLLNDTSTQGTAQPRQPFVPANHDVVVNQLWFLSMSLSLSAVVVGTLCLQWLSAFRRADMRHKPHDDGLALRQLRYEGLMSWGVPRVPAILLLAVQGAIVLFSIGLLYLLWSVSHRVALPVAIVSGVSVCLLTLTTVMPLLQSLAGWLVPQTLGISQCPFKSPISWVTHRVCVFLAIIISSPFSLIPPFKEKMSKWRSHQYSLLTDFVWQEYDELWRKQRERWGPQSKTGSSKYSYYLVRGFASAMETLVFHPHAVHIVHTCLQEFHETSVELEIFEQLFQKEFTKAEKDLLKAGSPSPTLAGKKGGENGHPPNSHLEHLRKDFLNAHALQHFVAHNQKLHRVLLPHRVELYVRIKNSSWELDLSGYRGSNGEGIEEIGRSIECPIQNPRDVQGLSTELRTQFLNCVSRLMGTEQRRHEDIKGAILVLAAIGGDELNQNQEDDDGELSTEDRFKRVLVMAEKHLSALAVSNGRTETGGFTENSPTSVQQVDLEEPEDPSASVRGGKCGDPAAPSSLSHLCQQVWDQLRQLPDEIQGHPDFADYFNHPEERHLRRRIKKQKTIKPTPSDLPVEKDGFSADCPV